MGKSYAMELSRLSDTYSWALEAPIDSLAAAVSASSNLPLLAVGSGGSFSAAHLASLLHQYHTGMLSKPVTPLELVSAPLHLRSLSVMVLSAAGSNGDIISAFQNACFREPRQCMVLCLRKGSALSRLARSYRFVELLELTFPSVKDGFLATNSLLSFGVLLIRAYNCAFSLNERLPRDFDALLAHSQGHRVYIEELRAQCESLWTRDTLVVLYGPSVSTAALDLESKFSEAALGNVQIADFRNFAHGRHNWLAKRGSKTGVLAICADDEQNLCERTLRLIPHAVPVARICLPSVGPTASVAALVAVFHIVAAAGERHGIDPGRPGIPTFGRRIYGLRALRNLNKPASGGQFAIARKLGCEVEDVRDRQDVEFWHLAYQRFVDRLMQATFGAMLLDYDGTLCDEQDRFLGPSQNVVQELTRLLNGGILLGIATGRGDSSRADLRKVLPKQLWDNVFLGYYNGSDIGRLSDDSHPKPSGPPCDSLKSVAEALHKHPIVSHLAKCKSGRDQISVRPLSRSSEELVWRLVQQLAKIHGLTALKSSHSMDVLRPNVSKCSLLTRIRSLLGGNFDVLSIGDKGQWPGNDYDLLSMPYSLSVDEASADPDTCWNIAPPGHRGVQALLDYFGWVQLGEASFRVAPPATTNRLP
jgi:hydroxymethylpyrimidine pyrophosphatase-like HAD family hydrolase